MFSAFALFVSFLLGGVTFIPLLLAVILGLLYYTSPIVHLPRKTGIPGLQTTNDDETEPVTLYRAGWLTVRRTYEPLLETNGTYVGMMVSGYRSFMDNRSRDPRRSKPKDQFYGVLKQNVLFLYDNEEQVDCWAAVEVSRHDVVIYPEGNLDGELFVKRNAIALKPRSVEGEPAAAAEAHTASEEATHDMDPSKPLPWFIFAKVNSDKEDWFHSLVQSSKLASPTTTATLEKDRSLFDPEDMASLIDGIDAQPDSIPMRWFNALLGRIFLAVYRTSTLEEYITSRIVRKLKRVKVPSILSEIQVREVNVGSAVPFFSKPMLKELTADGDASMEVHVSYVGDLRITIETVATINLGSRFKPYSVRLVLAVVLKEIEGTMLLKVKQPPSNRIWFGFSTMPRMVLSVEPVVSTRQIKWSMITSPIESRIREVVMESIVVPHMDDLSFFNSRPFATRGGIWGDALRKEQNLSAPVGEPTDDSMTVDTNEAEVEEIAGEPVPSVVGQDGVGSTTSATEASTSTARARTNRRTEDDSERRRTGGASIKSNSSSSSLSSFSLSSWRDSRNAAATASTSPTSTAAGSGDKRRSWFGPSRSSTTGSTSSLPNTSSTPVARSSTLDSPSTVDSASTTKTSAAEDSASRLRDLLAKRAHSREREKEARAATPSIREDSQVEESEATEATPKLSALSLTAPKSSLSSISSTSSFMQNDHLAVPSSTSNSRLDSSVLQTPISDSPNGSVEALPEQLVQPPSRLPTSQSSPSLSSTLERAAESTSMPPPTSTNAPPTIPSRPSFTKGLPNTPPPLPRRDQSHQSTQSADSTSSTTSSLLSSWRTKAADKQALSAGVAQAKDTMKRWGATWNARKAADEEASSGDREPGVLASSPPQDGGRSLSSSKERESAQSGRDGTRTPGGAESYRDYRAKKSIDLSAGEAEAAAIGAVDIAGEVSGRRTRESSANSASPPRASNRTPRPSLSSSPSAGHFSPAASSPTTKLSTAPTFASGSPAAVALANKLPQTAAVKTPSTSAPAARAYKPATMMAIPGIRDESRRNAVASDHVSAEESKKDEVKPEEPKEDIKPQAVIDPLPSLAVFPPPSVASTPSPPLLPPPPPPRPVVVAPDEPSPASRPVPPPPPPRPAVATTTPEVEPVKSSPPAVPPRPTTEGTFEPLNEALQEPVVRVSPVKEGTTKVAVEEDDAADEAGWGLGEDEGEATSEPAVV